MSEIDTPYKRAVHMIIHSIINCEDKYVLDKQYVRWGKVERDLWRLEYRHLTSRPSRAAGAKAIQDCQYIFKQPSCKGCWGIPPSA